MRLFLSLLAAVLWLPVLPAQEPAKDKNDKSENALPSPDKKNKSEVKADAGEADPFDIPVQENVPVKGLRIPQYDKDGVLKLMFDAEVARKVDAEHVEIENLKIDAYSDEGKKIYIEMPQAVFNMETRVLDGKSRVLIRREDFEITGDGGQFHTKTRFAKILGNVKMIILSTDSFDQP